MPTATDDTLTTLLSSCQRRWGRDALRRGFVSAPPVDPLSTGYPALDELLAGGLRPSTLSLWQGQATSGVTSVALRTVATTQAATLPVVWLDGARTFDPFRALQCGVALPRLVLVRPHDSVELLAILTDLLRAATLPLVVVQPPLHRGLARTADATWRRMHHALARARTVLLWLMPQPHHANVPGSLLLAAHHVTHLRFRGQCWLQAAQTLVGYRTEVEVLRDPSGQVGQRLTLEIAL